MGSPSRPFTPPSRGELLVNHVVTLLVRLGIAPGHMYLLEVRGRKTGTRYSVPVDLLSAQGKLYLVAPRGWTQWARNADAVGEVTLRRGGRADRYRARTLSVAERPPILKAYLERFRREVQRFFPVPAGSPVEAFVGIADRHPAFELTRSS